MVTAMRARFFVFVGLLFSAPLSHAAEPSPAAAVDLLLHANHGISEMSGKEVMDTWEAVRRDPAPYLPHLRAYLTLERIEAAKDPVQLHVPLSALGLLFRLGGSEERGFARDFLEQLQAKRDELSVPVEARIRAAGADARALADDPSFRDLIQHRGRFTLVAHEVIRRFSERGDPSLRDLLLPRLDQDADMRDASIEYFEATCRKDPLVRARLKKMLEGPLTPLTRYNLKHFFEEP